MMILPLQALALIKIVPLMILSEMVFLKGGIAGILHKREGRVPADERIVPVIGSRITASFPFFAAYLSALLTTAVRFSLPW
jgi:hypothetical protein